MLRVLLYYVMKYLKLYNRPHHDVNNVDDVINYISEEFGVTKNQIRFTKYNNSLSYDDIYSIDLYNKLGELFAIVGTINFNPNI